MCCAPNDPFPESSAPLPAPNAVARASFADVRPRTNGDLVRLSAIGCPRRQRAGTARRSDRRALSSGRPRPSARRGSTDGARRGSHTRRFRHGVRRWTTRPGDAVRSRRGLYRIGQCVRARSSRCARYQVRISIATAANFRSSTPVPSSPLAVTSRSAISAPGMPCRRRMADAGGRSGADVTLLDADDVPRAERAPPPEQDVLKVGSTGPPPRPDPVLEFSVHERAQHSRACSRTVGRPPCSRSASS